MEVSLIKIGNSKGIRLSKTLIEKYNLRDKVEFILEEGHILIKPSSLPHARVGMRHLDKCMRMVDDQLLFDDVFDDENSEEWTISPG